MDIPDEVLIFVSLKSLILNPQVIIPHYQRVTTNGDRDDSSGVGSGQEKE